MLLRGGQRHFNTGLVYDNKCLAAVKHDPLRS